jgi:two-component system CheB/CheR fusion protein
VADLPFPIIALGASAGGLEALTTVIARLPTRLGAAVIVVQHLSPDHRSLMPELLARQTRMPVHTAEDGMVLEPDRLILNPPGKDLTIEAGILRVRDPEPGRLLHLPIDTLLSSLAQYAGDRVVAAILSGTGSDGTRGCRAIKESGGTVLVQDPADARFDGMPRSAISQATVDLVAPAADIAGALVGEVQRRSEGGMMPPPGDQDDIDRILAWLSAQTTTDFSEYKRTTVLRRIERRMVMNQCGSAPEYLAFLQANPAEAGQLVRELLICVTRFFRDPEAFAALQEQVIAPMFDRHADGSPMRVWVPGCATGEEAYTLAILFSEEAERRGAQLNLKIFATDLDRVSVEAASAGVYPESIVADLGEQRIQRWFVKKGDRYHIGKPIRDLVVVAAHNLLRDPPFFRIDLVSCRNLFIYLESRAQRRVLNGFHFALVSGGHLFMGGAESPSDLDEAFTVLDPRAKIFQARVGAVARVADTLSDPFSITRHPGRAGALKMPVEAIPHDSVVEALLSQFVPPSLVLDESLEVVHIIGDVGRYLTIPTGKASLHISRIAPRELALALSTGVRQAIKDGINVALGRIQVGDQVVEIEVRPFVGRRLGSGFALAVMRTPALPVQAPAIEIPIEAGQRIEDLERELERTKMHLQTAVEEVENANEELQATNEELLAANEELQSTNEELQSVNEELYSVNSEYQAKITELTEMNDDMANFLKGTSIGAVFADAHLCVRKFTPAVTRQINLIERDIGRPLAHISHNLVGVDLMGLARQVVDTFVAHESEVSTSTGGCYQMRILPYRTEGHVVAGVVLTFVDIGEIRRAAGENRHLVHALDRVRDAVLITDGTGTIVGANDAFLRRFGYVLGELVGHNPRMLQSGAHDHGFWKDFWTVLRNGSVWRGRITNRTKDGRLVEVACQVVPVGKPGAIEGYILVGEAPVHA